MTADPKQVLRILDHRGIDVRLVDGRLIGRPRHGIAMPEDMVRFIRHFKKLITTELTNGAVQPAPAGPPSDDATDAVHVLERRLMTGEAICNAEHDADRKDELDTHWINLLHDYETAHTQSISDEESGAAA